jgi:hypothetical protein
MTPPNLEDRCKKAILRMADDVKDINFKLTHFLDKYRDDFYKSQDSSKYQPLY